MGDSRGCFLRSATVHGPVARAVMVGAVVALLVATTGCSGSADQASPLPTPTSSKASPSPTASTPKQQVEAAAREYIGALDVALRSGDSRRFQAITTNECPCRGFVDNLKEKFEPGRYPGAGAEVVSVGSVVAGKGYASADLVYRVSAYVEMNAGRVVRRFPERTTPITLLLVERESRWVVSKSIDRNAKER